MKTSIPRAIDEPPMMLLWPLDEFIFIVVLLGFGIMLKKLLISIAVIWLSMRLYRRIREGHPKGYFIHYLYSLGLVLPKSNVIKNPFEEEFLP